MVKKKEMMMATSTKNMIDAIASNDNIEAEKQFKSTLATKIGVELDNKRKDLSGTIMNKPAETKNDNTTQSTEIDT